ncbi:hypothetical protein CPAST_c14510 [Clostridium pasteurianum DSM 525 = ATCC 6013]|uniref:Tetratricopeptide TPR_2 repeat-containing protein n=1 Tax=Clostridium pasteurianum DSM 525 = ATCC 6013 TaxID=1262449 RepID=A0A0H3J8W2_CLOPA|nr:helix-turn-helix transcriptional regulator [Clostridium pasteurianum]AJA47530.1 hypothetical protein CPAST_c14510 [Clostridium pasteurianum DSM 525 = ATCC 6013]AJA51518.1 hypothetical protein CLPA_c14510 [Clostridium pasteurianum DSM 525 = ATCC 6013]AOZ74847.1 ferrous iron transport protein B [Clostridium pasteurianum DSM 525 = ATCC 6013]AOZ78643.1 ferrous iron transport protein B [Clostridium pasteurianum]ELP57634.1 hypothetical protein F502_18451 [Clostridium pasteurianum DSM 525 = ATCC 6
MEILSIGEKIKRTRIYKGYTLKDICEEKISVSKMSCIENGKIKPEDWILELISNKLGMDIEYLKKDVREQLKFNLNEVKVNYNKTSQAEILKYNLDYAEEYKYYDIAFEFMHILFSYYLEIKDIKSCQDNTARYYKLCRNSDSEKNKLIYYMDIGKYFYAGNEYFQAASYYNNVRKTLMKNESKDYNFLISAIYEEANCIFMMGQYENAYEILNKIIDIIKFINDSCYKAKIFNLLGRLSIGMNNGKFREFEKESYKLVENNRELKAKFIYNYGCAMLKTNMDENAYDYINEAISLYPEEVNRDFVHFILDVIKTLIQINKISQAKELCDKILNYSIDLHEDVFIEKSYYFKALIMHIENNIEMSEMYMNLSLDILMKIGDKNTIKDRYMEMGVLYFEMKNTSESLKYFNLALNMDKKI